MAVGRQRRTNDVVAATYTALYPTGIGDNNADSPTGVADDSDELKLKNGYSG